MTKERRLQIYNVLAFLCSVWFLLLGWIWVYWVNVMIVFPFAILGFFFWRAGRDADIKLLNKITGWVLVAGLVSSIAFFVGLLTRN